MRNLKRALSLGLTATMISGLMVMGSSAASYADVTSEQNQEAIEVLKTVGIMVGDENGKFNPEAKVTRNEMAVVMSNLMAYNVASYKDTSPFTDVPEWAEPYVAACYTNGITSGYDKVTYGGKDNVTTAQAALMVMKALGYFQYQSDFGADWQLSTVAQGNKIDLFDDVDSGVKEAMTRNDLAQLVLNALESGTVEADDDTIKFENGDMSVTAGKVKYNFITSGKDYATAINDTLATNNDGSYSTGSIVELGEKLYQGDLTKEDGYDDFGRPANVWDYQAKEIGTFADTADNVFTAKVTSKGLYNAVGKTAVDNYKWTVSVDGEEVTDFSAKDLAANKSDDDADVLSGIWDGVGTGNGVVTEVFVDGTDKTVDVAVIHYYAAEVYEVKEDDGVITLTDLDNGPADNNDEFETNLFAEDDIVMYSYANGDIQDVYAAEKLEGEVTRVRANNNDSDGDNFTVDGTTYKYNKTAVKDRLVTDSVNNDVVAYLDANGYVAYIDESAVTYDYAYVLSVGHDDDQFGGGENGKTYYARLVLTDGTMIKVETDIKNDTEKAKVEDHIVAYSKDKGDVYTLTAKDTVNEDKKTTGTNGAQKAESATALNIENGVASFDAVTTGGYVANSNTVFVVADSDTKLDDYDFTVYTGIKNVPDITGKTGTYVDVAADEDGVAKVVYVKDAEVSGSGSVYFIHANKDAKLVKDKDGNKYYEIDAVVDGEVKTLMVKDGSDAADLLVDCAGSKFTTADKYDIGNNHDEYIVVAKSITENSDGLVTNVKLYDHYNDGDGTTVGSKTGKVERETVGVNGSRYAWDDDVVVVRFNYKGDFEISRIGSIKDDYNDDVIFVRDDKVLTGICIIEKDGTGVDNGKDPVITDDGTAESATISITDSGLGEINVIDRKDTGKDADELARKALADANFKVNSVSGNTYFVTAPNGQAYTFTMNTPVVLAPISLAENDENVSITSPKTVYLAEDDSVTVQLTNSGDWAKEKYTVSVSGVSDVTASEGTADGNIVTFKLTASTDLTSSDTATLTWRGK